MRDVYLRFILVESDYKDERSGLFLNGGERDYPCLLKLLVLGIFRSYLTAVKLIAIILEVSS